MTGKQATEVAFDIANGVNFVISGRISSGKSQLCKTLAKLAADSKYEYCIIDEACTPRDVDYIDGLLIGINKNDDPRRVIFTYHNAWDTSFRYNVPHFNGKVLHLTGTRNVEDNLRIMEIEKKC